MEVTFAVKPVGVKCLCDSCKLGEMSYTGTMKMHSTCAIFVHKCENCLLEVELKEKYPLIRYEIV
jgi:hypothetical protein